MRKLACSGIFALVVMGSAYAADNPALGEWRVEDGVATVKIVDCNGRLWGVVASEKTSGGIDQMNPDPSKRRRLTLGIPVLINMKRVADERDKWEGSIYNAKDGKTYDASIQVRSPNTLVVEGCVLSILCGGQTWTRVTDSTAAAPKGAAAGLSPVTGSSPSAPKPQTQAQSSSGHPPPLPGAAPKVPVAGQKPAGQVSEVCLLPEIAGAPH